MTTAWDTLSTAMATARAELAAVTPDPATAAEAEAYLARLVTASLADAFLSHHFVQGGLTKPLMVKGGPNPDFLSLHAPIDPTRRYRLEGCLHESERVGVGLYAFGADGTTLRLAYASFDRTTLNSDGRFSLDMAADAVGPGTLPLAPTCRVMLIRILHRRPDARPSTLTLTGGATARNLALATGSTDGAVAQAAQAVLRGVRQFILWTQATAANPNVFAEPPPQIADYVRGDPDITYYLGYYDLRDAEWLEVTLGAIAGYWSVHAYNHWLESLPCAGAHDLNAVPDRDGLIRLHVGPGLSPDLSNRIDTLGRRRGVLIFRNIGGTAVPAPRTAVRR